jgi:hypothetical protein
MPSLSKNGHGLLGQIRFLRSLQREIRSAERRDRTQGTSRRGRDELSPPYPDCTGRNDKTAQWNGFIIGFKNIAVPRSGSHLGHARLKASVEPPTRRCFLHSLWPTPRHGLQSFKSTRLLSTTCVATTYVAHLRTDFDAANKASAGSARCGRYSVFQKTLWRAQTRIKIPRPTGGKSTAFIFADSWICVWRIKDLDIAICAWSINVVFP